MEVGEPGATLIQADIAFFYRFFGLRKAIENWLFTSKQCVCAMKIYVCGRRIITE